MRISTGIQIKSVGFLATRAIATAALLGSFLMPGLGHAFEVPADERAKLKACEQSLCEIILKKEATGPDLTCALSKTWAKDKIKEGIEAKQINWSLGDARCSVALDIKREQLYKALTEATFDLDVPKHNISCEVEREAEITPVTMSLSPKLKFQDGKAVGANLGIADIDAPALIKGAIWTVAKFEETFGLFEDDMIREVNEFMHEKCAKRYRAN